MKNRLEQRLGTPRPRGGRGVVPYVTAGDGGMDTTFAVLHALERSGAVAIELGLPFSDPIADGAILQAAAQRALASGTTFEGLLALVRRFRATSELPLCLMTYANPLFRRGIARALSQLADAGIDGLLVVDLPPDEARVLTDAAKVSGLAPIFFASPTSDDERVRSAAAASRGYLYAIGRLGVTGERMRLDEATLAFLRRVRKLSAGLPVAAGFGIATPDQVRAVLTEADLAVVGSALVECIHAATAEGGRIDPQRAAEAAEGFLRTLTGDPAL